MSKYGLSTIHDLDDALYLELEELFPDWESINPGEWSVYNRIVRLDDETELEIGIYKEPRKNEEYANTYTLQIFINDNVIFNKTVFCNDEE